MKHAWLASFLVLQAGFSHAAHGQDSVRTAPGPAGRDTTRTIIIRFVEADLRVVVQGLGQYLDRPLITAGLPAETVTLDHPAPVPVTRVPGILRGLAESRGMRLEVHDEFYLLRGGTGAAAADREPVELHVVRLRHARSADVAAVVNQLFGGGGGFAGSQGLSGGTLADELRASRAPPAGPGQPADTARRAGTVTGPVTIVPDELTNSLMIRATGTDFEIIRGAVEQLDIRPLQVLIEVLIVEARADRGFSLGADVLVPPQRFAGGTASAEVSGNGLGDLVLRFMNLGKAEIDAVVRAAQSRGDAEIVSRPVLLASNNTEARFLVGSQRPFVQVSRSLPTDAPSRDQVVQYRDVGTKLLVRPTINPDGYVSLLVQQEINAATGEVQFDAPVISTREAVTQVLVRDGQTIVIGGLRDLQRERIQRGVPLLSGIPLLGGLFGSASRRASRTELYLFVTPRILRTDEDADRVTAPRLPEPGPPHEP